MSPRVFLTLTIALVAPAADAGTLVAFRPKASVANGLVTLGDIADVRSTDVAVAQKLSATLLGPGPDAGREATFTFEGVRSRLMAAGANLSEIEFSGPTTVIVHGPEATPVRPVRRPTPSAPAGDDRKRGDRAASAAVRRYLLTKGLTSPAVELHLPEAEAAKVAAAEAHGFEVSGGQAPWTGPQTFALRFLDASEQVCEVRVGGVVSQLPSVLAAKRALPKGHILRPDDLVWKKAESEIEACGTTDPAELLGRETQRPIRTGQPILPEAVRVIPLVRGGQFVTVTSRRPGVAVHRVMKAKADGGLDEVISLTTLEDQKAVLARVTGLQEAEIVDLRGGLPDSATRTVQPEQIAVDPWSLESTSVMPEAPRVRVNPTQPLTVPAGPAHE